MFSLEGITTSVQDWLFMKFNPTIALAMECVIVILLAISLFALLGLVLVLMERKVAAHIQIRLGPNRVGPGGMFQTVADTLKLIMKEGLVPDMADKFLFNLAPFVVMMVGMLLLAPIAFAKNFQIWDINIGVLYISSVSSLSVIGILMAGWASNNKYSLLGAMRSGAQIVSYELSAGFAVLTIVVLTGSLQISEIVKAQENGWWIFKGHIPAVIAFVLYIIAVIFLAEYINIFIVCAIGATLFFGGWMPLHIGNWSAFNHIMDYIPSSVWFMGKTFFLIFLIMWFRWTFPRLRVDQLLNLEWKYLLPISLFNILLVAIIAILGWHF